MGCREIPVVVVFELSSDCVIPTARVFTSGPSDLACTIVALLREIPRSA
jgi:hypothetical protein